ncbi:MAG: hypothetical protein C5S49_06390 [Candidatus Methanogaster sp.]|nr:MAG: hypothetical protein C5S49_06390 [ANME-2 cluster archaeon]
MFAGLASYFSTDREKLKRLPFFRLSDISCGSEPKLRQINHRFRHPILVSESFSFFRTVEKYDEPLIKKGAVNRVERSHNNQKMIKTNYHRWIFFIYLIHDGICATRIVKEPFFLSISEFKSDCDEVETPQ